ncbi:MAG TPA: response regulator transcription factor [Candidatus Sulfotelmatobacter sp.]|nr:response regulator transcription factor [Candidatus Sulfotelmatobacter sp.]
MEQRPIRIIIADDHAIFRDGLRRLLTTDKRFTVVAEAADGKEGARLTHELNPDILLLDLAMPRVPGMEVLRELAHDKHPVYIILLTAAIQPFEVTAAFQLGARGVVLKSSPPELLLKAIHAVAEGKHWVEGEALTDWTRILRKPTGIGGLTSREMEIISEIQSGSSNREIANKLAISEETVKRHLSNIFAKLGVSSRLELALLATKHNLGTWNTTAASEDTLVRSR